MQMYELLEAALNQTGTQGDGKAKAWGKSVNGQSVCVAWQRVDSKPSDRDKAPELEVMNLAVSIPAFHHISSSPWHLAKETEKTRQ